MQYSCRPYGNWGRVGMTARLTPSASFFRACEAFGLGRLGCGWALGSRSGVMLAEMDDFYLVVLDMAFLEVALYPVDYFGDDLVGVTRV